MRRISRNCRKRCMGCDDCWICRHSYPDSIIITSLEGYTPCCTNIIGTFATAPWGQQYGGFLEPVTHFSFGVTDTPFFEKPKCSAYWGGDCAAGDGSRLWSILLSTGVDPDGVVRSGDPESTRLNAVITIDQYDPVFVGVLRSSRVERFQIDLPKPCPKSGVFELSPLGTPEISDFGFLPECMDTTDFLHEFAIEIVES